MKTIALVCEGPTDARTAMILADELICRDVGCVQPEDLDNYRRYCGYQSQDPLKWKQISNIARQLKIVSVGHMNGLPVSDDAHNTAMALRLFDKCKPRPDAVMFIRDADKDSDRKKGIVLARKVKSPANLPVIIGIAITMTECWVIAGFQPVDEYEKSRVKALLSGDDPGVGFDPRLCSEELTAPKGHKRSSKRVLEHLTDGDHERERLCLVTIVKDQLHVERGQNNGLHDFISEIKTKLIPLFIDRNHV